MQINRQIDAETVKRARELRAQGLTLRAIEQQMQNEGHKITYVTIRKYTKDLYDRPAPKSRTHKLRVKREWYYRNANRINADRRAERANESPEERAERLQYDRLMRSLQQALIKGDTQ